MDFNWTEIAHTTYRACISLVALFFVTKLIGKKQVSQLSLFDYVVGISIGNFAAEMTINLEASEVNGIVAVTIFGLIAFTVSYLTMKSVKIRKFFAGSPTLLVQEGKIITKNMRKVRFDVDDLLEVCRCNGFFNLNEIQYALMEANGEISFLPKADYKPVTAKDMNLKLNQDSLVANIILDGKVMKKNLENMNKDEEWLNKQLKVLGYYDMKNIILATLDASEKLIIYEKEFSGSIKNVLD
jgi:uncharacterized membrane protein YcaP (DUF421 family)